MSKDGKTRVKVKSVDSSTLPSLPKGWCWATIGDLASPEPNSITDGPFGSNLKSSHYTDSGPRVIRLQNIGNGVFIDEKAHVSQTHFDALSKHHIFPGDLVIAALGETLPRSCVLPYRVGPAMVKADCPRFKPNCNIVSSEYVNHVLNSSETRHRTKGIIHGVGRPRLNLSEIRGIWIPVAPFNEQRRIVAKIEELFSDLDAGVAALERVKANLKRYLAAVLKAAVEGKLTEEWRAKNPPKVTAAQFLQRILIERRNKWEEAQLAAYAKSDKSPPKNWKERYKEPATPDTSNLPELPKGWCWATADQISSQITDGEHIQPPYQPFGHPMLTATHVRDGQVQFTNVEYISKEDFVKCLKRCAPTNNDILVVSVGATTGRAGIVTNCEPFAIVRSVLLLRPVVMPIYLLSWIQSPWCQIWISRASGASAQAHFYISDAKRMPVPLPPSNEQEIIIEEIEQRLTLVDICSKIVDMELKRSSRLRQSILKRAFEGKLVPQDPSDEPAAVLLGKIRVSTNSGNSKKPIKSSRKK